MIRITVYGGIGPDDETGPYHPETTVRVVPDSEVSETLRKLGLEWRQADYFPNRQTVITLDPVPDEDDAARSVSALVREAVAKLEATGLL